MPYSGARGGVATGDACPREGWSGKAEDATFGPADTGTVWQVPGSGKCGGRASAWVVQQVPGSMMGTTVLTRRARMGRTGGAAAGEGLWIRPKATGREARLDGDSGGVGAARSEEGGLRPVGSTSPGRLTGREGSGANGAASNRGRAESARCGRRDQRKPVRSSGSTPARDSPK